MAIYESNPGHLAGILRSQDDIIMYIGNQMVQIWEHCGFPNGHIYSCRPYMDRMESKPQRYVLVVRTPHDRAKDIDWGKKEWTVNIVGKPQLKIKGILIGNSNTWGYHIGWDITFYVDVLDIVKPEGKRPESVAIDEDAIAKEIYNNDIARRMYKSAINITYGKLAKSVDKKLKDVATCMEEILNISLPEDYSALKYIDTDMALTKAIYGLSSENDNYKIGGNTMNNHEIENAIRDGGYTDYQRNTIKGFLLRNGLLSNTNLEEVRNIRRDLRPSPKKVIYNGPATIVIFEDGSKTVVKLQEGEQMDREKAVYAAICKRMFGSNKNRSNWLDMLKPLMKEADEAWKVKSEANALNDDI